MTTVYDYAPITATASQLIAKYGRAITLQSESVTPADANAPWDGPAQWDDGTAAAERKVAATGVFVGAGATEFKDIAGGLIRRGKSGFLISGSLSVDVADFDSIKDGTDLWKIDRVETLKPGSDVVLYGVEVSR